MLQATPKPESPPPNTDPPSKWQQAEEKRSTLFPKISGKIAEIGANYINKTRHEKADSHLHVDISTLILPLIGTVKLHGAHADLVIHPNNKITIQSRNIVGLTPTGKDVYGIAAVLEPLGKQTLELRDKYHTRFRELNPGVDILPEHPTIIAGEWIGPGVQKNVAISKLPQRYFVILSVSINNSWLPNEEYAHIHAENHGIYNISRGGFFHSTIHFGQQPETRARLEIPTMQVEKECPFAKSLGVSGIGEGIVWKVVGPLGADTRFWLKTKGPLHAVSNTERIPQRKKGMGNQDAAREFAGAAVTEARLEQGWGYLGEMGVEREMKSMRKFLEWVVGDVEVEEKSVIEKLGLEGELVKKTVEAIGRKWYIARWKRDIEW